MDDVPIPPMKPKGRCRGRHVNNRARGVRGRGAVQRHVAAEVADNGVM